MLLSSLTVPSLFSFLVSWTCKKKTNKIIDDPPSLCDDSSDEEDEHDECVATEDGSAKPSLSVVPPTVPIPFGVKVMYVATHYLC